MRGRLNFPTAVAATVLPTMDPPIYKILGEPLNLLIKLIGDRGFSNLYGTGDPVLGNRIKKCPLVCEDVPNRFSENVVSLSTNYITHYNEKFIFMRWDKNGRKDVKAPFPSSLNCLSIVNMDVLRHIIPYLGSLTSLSIHNSYSNSERGFILPQSLVTLEISTWFKGMMGCLPSSLTELTINGTHCDKKCDFSHLNLLKFTCRALYTEFVLPTSLISLFDSTREIGDEFPQLKHARVAEYIGKDGGKLELLEVYRGELPLVAENCTVVMQGITYSNGVLLIESGLDLYNAKSFAKLHLRSVKFNKEVDKEDMKKMLAKFVPADVVLKQPTVLEDGFIQFDL